MGVTRAVTRENYDDPMRGDSSLTVEVLYDPLAVSAEGRAGLAGEVADVASNDQS